MLICGDLVLEIWRCFSNFEGSNSKLNPRSLGNLRQAKLGMVSKVSGKKFKKRNESPRFSSPFYNPQKTTPNKMLLLHRKE